MGVVDEVLTRLAPRAVARDVSRRRAEVRIVDREISNLAKALCGALLTESEFHQQRLELTACGERSCRCE